MHNILAINWTETYNAIRVGKEILGFTILSLIGLFALAVLIFAALDSRKRRKHHEELRKKHNVSVHSFAALALFLPRELFHGEHPVAVALGCLFFLGLCAGAFHLGCKFFLGKDEVEEETLAPQPNFCDFCGCDLELSCDMGCRLCGPMMRGEEGAADQYASALIPLRSVLDNEATRLASMSAGAQPPRCTNGETQTRGRYRCTREAGHDGPCAAALVVNELRQPCSICARGNDQTPYPTYLDPCGVAVLCPKHGTVILQPDATRELLSLIPETALDEKTRAELHALFNKRGLGLAECSAVDVAFETLPEQAIVSGELSEEARKEIEALREEPYRRIFGINKPLGTNIDDINAILQRGRTTPKPLTLSKKVRCGDGELRELGDYSLADRLHLSAHEWTWTPDEATQMAVDDLVHAQQVQTLKAEYGELQLNYADVARMASKLTSQITESHESLAQAASVVARLEELLRKHGICPKCGEPWEHDGQEPFAYCRCGTSEWTYKTVDELPTIMRQQLRAELTIAELRQQVVDTRIQFTAALHRCVSALTPPRNAEEDAAVASALLILPQP